MLPATARGAPRGGSDAGEEGTRIRESLGQSQLGQGLREVATARSVLFWRVRACRRAGEIRDAHIAKAREYAGLCREEIRNEGIGLARTAPRQTCEMTATWTTQKLKDNL